MKKFLLVLVIGVLFSCSEESRKESDDTVGVIGDSLSTGENESDNSINRLVGVWVSIEYKDCIEKNMSPYTCFDVLPELSEVEITELEGSLSISGSLNNHERLQTREIEAGVFLLAKEKYSVDFEAGNLTITDPAGNAIAYEKSTSAKVEYVIESLVADEIIGEYELQNAKGKKESTVKFLKGGYIEGWESFNHYKVLTDFVASEVACDMITLTSEDENSEVFGFKVKNRSIELYILESDGGVEDLGKKQFVLKPL